MSIICQSDVGWVICHRSYIDKLYKGDPNSATYPRYKINPVFFDIKTPFVMDSSAFKHSKSFSPRSQLPSDSSNLSKRPRQKKREVQDHYHTKIKSQLKHSLKQLKTLASDCGYLLEDSLTAEDIEENNLAARTAAKQTNFMGSHISAHCCNNAQNNKPSRSSITMIDTCLIDHDKENSSIFTLGDEKYIMPPESRFIFGDISCLEKFLEKGEKFDFILLDPPWNNKSVKRKKCYSQLNDECLQMLPITELASTVCVLAVWATNNMEQINFIKDVLFPQWSATHQADWHWIKITSRGEPVRDLEDLHKRCYENLIIGCIGETQNMSNCEKFANHKVFLSIPSIIHSHKPPLTEIMKPHLPSKAKHLELFARYLLPGYTSFGNEVIKLQNLKLFQQVV